MGPAHSIARGAEQPMKGIDAAPVVRKAGHSAGATPWDARQSEMDKEPAAS